MDLQKIQDLKTLISGTIAVPGDAIYDTARTMFEHTITPSVVVRPVSPEDIAATLLFVSKHKVSLGIRSGGHGSIDSHVANDMLLIDMSHFNTTEVLNTDEGLVRIGAGALWHQVAAELDEYKLGLSSGDTRTVGVGGLATGGGLGWMVRKYGPLVDSIVAVEIVTADGSVINASQHENADLFWAVRGGGSNFGVVTYFTFEAHRVTNVFTGTIVYPLAHTRHILQGWRDAMRVAPDELSTILTILPSLGGAPPAIIIKGCFIGTDKTAADTAYAPFTKLSEVVRQNIASEPYMDLLEDAKRPTNSKVIVQNAFLKEFSNEAIDAIVEICNDKPLILQIRHVAGAMNKRAHDATAFSHRDSEVLIVNPAFVLPPGTNKEQEIATAPWQKIKPFGQGVYLNLLSEDTGNEVAMAFPAATLERLRKIKSLYDPENIFTTNYNITPYKP